MISSGFPSGFVDTLRPRTRRTASCLSPAKAWSLFCGLCGATAPGPIRRILTHLGEAIEPPLIVPARGPPIDWGELVQAHDDRDVFQASTGELPVIDIHSLW